MTYVKTTLQHSIDIDAIITLHYFEYMKNFEFKGESHNFWEFLYVDKGTVAVRADDTWTTLYTGDIIFHQRNEFHAIKSIASAHSFGRTGTVKGTCTFWLPADDSPLS